ncbi:tetratricopeptide repeat protein [Pleurocapsales cyanobacterium LEGE 10410]|nr:tetratricopeptide repeat protein [Pleurocapsales cyanobacterium LEGE 10410]
MSHSRNKVLLGAVLQQAGLVSAEGIKQALKQQALNNNSPRIGEILTKQGHIDFKTADFFAERWSDLVLENPKQPIGQYLEQAGLLNKEQIQKILDEQKQTKLKFGELAIAKGWLKQTTVDFFLRYLTPVSSAKSEANSGFFAPEFSLGSINETVKTTKQPKPTNRLKDPQQIHESFLEIKFKLLKLEDRHAYSEQILARVLLWTGGQSFLTQKLFKLISENSSTLVPDREIEQIDYLVQTRIIDHWSNNQLKEHFLTIEDRLLHNQQCEPRKLLQLYQQILSETIFIDNSKEQQELLNMGLVVKQQNQLVVANRIYQSVFSLSWVTNKLTNQTSQSNLPTAAINNSGKVVSPSPNQKGKDSFWQLKNILLLLASMGLLWVLFNNIGKRIVVRLAFDRGNELLQKKSFEQAIAEYNRLLNIDSNYYQAWTNRGYALAQLQRYQEMRQSCSTATIIKPKAVDAWNCQGEALHNLQREDEAIVAFDRAIALEQTEPIFLINKSESLRALGKNEESLTVIKEAIRLLEEAEAIEGQASVSGELAVALTFLGNRYRRKEQYELAVDTYNRALEYSSNYFPARINLGVVLSQGERYQAAQDVFENILDSNDLTPAQQGQTWFYLGKTLCKSQQTGAGIAALEQAMKLQPDYEIAAQARKQCTSDEI